MAKRYAGHTALHDVSFQVPVGVTGLLGANGAGKTTLLGMIIGLHPVSGGTLRVFGQDPWSNGAEIRQYLGYSPEHHTLPPDMAADEFVRHVAELHGLPKAEAQTRSSDALWLVGLGEERFRPMGTMSTGQRQRVKLAQAIAHDPRLVLLDEPTDGLDPIQRDTMLDLIASIAKEFQISVILSSHLLAEVERICDAAVIIGDGKTLANGPLSELMGTGGVILAELDGSDSAMAEAVALLNQQGIRVEPNGRRLLLSQIEPPVRSHAGSKDHALEIADDDALCDAVRDVAVATGCGIIRLTKTSRSLEDVFLEQTIHTGQGAPQ